MKFFVFYGGIDSLNYFADKICEQLHVLGHETCVVDMNIGNFDCMTDWVQKKVDAAIMFDGIGMVAKELLDMLSVPVINILMDHPMTFAQYMSNPPKQFIQFSPDEDHVNFLKKYYGIHNSFFLPHMGSAHTDCDNVGEKIRKIDVLFSASYKSYNDIYQEIKSEYPEKFQLLFFEMINYLLENTDATVEYALYVCSENLGYEMTEKQFAKVMAIAKPVDEFVRMYFRSLVMTEIVKSGIPVTIIGNGWESFEQGYCKNVTKLPGVEFRKIASYMKNSKVVLNVMPWFKSGTHDRIFNSLLCGACPFTDGSKWLLSHFQDGKECAYYSINKLSEIPVRLYELLEDDEKREDIIKRGRKIVLCNYTQIQIVNEILAKLALCGFNKE